MKTYHNVHVYIYRDYKFHIFMSGDYEFLTSMYGLSGASGKHKQSFIRNFSITFLGRQSLVFDYQ